MSIENELMAGKKYQFDMDRGLVALTIKNVGLVEGMLKLNSSYKKAGDINAKPGHGYKGSTAYWVNELRKEFSEKNVEGVVNAVDRENSTHLNADKKGRDDTRNRILKYDNFDSFESALLDTDNYPLITQIAEITTAETRARVNFSYATKFCHFMCFYLYKDEEKKDLYSIYDNVLARVIPDYAREYGVDKNSSILIDGKLEEYKKADDKAAYYSAYQKLIEDIIRKGKEPISRNGFDHLLWYTNK